MMRAGRIAVVVAFAALACARPVRAQEPGQVGLVIGYPASVGVLWQVSDRFALRPELSLSQSSTDSTTSSPVGAFAVSNDNWQASVGASALCYVGKWESLRTYVSPRFAYSRTQVTSSST